MHQRSHWKSLQRVSLLSLFLLAAMSASRSARAQALPTASRSTAFSAFAGYTNSDPDYGRFRNSGATIGVDYTHFFGWRIVPSLEVRGNYSNGTDIKQESLLLGLRAQINHGRYHPYADALFGGTKIIFAVPITPTYTQDSAATTSFGGGIDIDVTRNIGVKFDYQAESMDFGPNGTQPNNADFSLSPSLVTVGVVYHIPFGRHR